MVYFVRYYLLILLSLQSKFCITFRISYTISPSFYNTPILCLTTDEVFAEYKTRLLFDLNPLSCCFYIDFCLMYFSSMTYSSYTEYLRLFLIRLLFFLYKKFLNVNNNYWCEWELSLVNFVYPYSIYSIYVYGHTQSPSSFPYHL